MSDCRECSNLVHTLVDSCQIAADVDGVQKLHAMGFCRTHKNLEQQQMKPTPQLERAMLEAKQMQEDPENYWAAEATRANIQSMLLRGALDTAHRHLSIYRWVAIVGWLIAIALLTLQPTYASAATLPVGSLACDNALAYEAQMLTFSDATLVADPGCVFTDRDLTVYPVQGNEVFVESIGFSVWADVEVLQ